MTYHEFIQKILDTRGRFNLDLPSRQRHHIVPRCHGGNNNDDNLIDLTRSEHLEAHRLLSIENPNDIRLLEAYRQMAKIWGKYLSEEQKNYLDNLPPQIPWNKGLSFDDEYKNKISIATKIGMNNPETRYKCGKAQRGRQRTPEEKEKISKTERGRIRPRSEIEKMIETKKNLSLLNPHYYDKISISHLGNKNPMYGKISYNAISLRDTETNIIFNSMKEARKYYHVGRNGLNKLILGGKLRYENKDN